MKQGKKKKRTDFSVRELTTADAYNYSKIAAGTDLHKYAKFFEASTLDEARKRIVQSSNRYESLYGLFTKAKRLVAVFYVSEDIDNTAIVHYFVGEQYYGNNYAIKGIRCLSDVLSGIYSCFHFEINKENVHSINVQNKLGSIECDPTGAYRNFIYSF